MLNTLHELYRENVFIGDSIRCCYKSKLLKYPDMQTLFTQTRSFVKIALLVCGEQEAK